MANDQPGAPLNTSTPGEDPAPPGTASASVPIADPPPAPLPNNVPLPLTLLGVAVGAAISIGGFLDIRSGPAQLSPGYLAICVGFGIILVAFGSRAIGRFGDWTVAGCGAVAIVLYLIITQLPAPVAKPYVVVHLRNTHTMQGILVKASDGILVGRPNTGQNYNMLVFPKDFSSAVDYFDITFQNAADKNPKEFTIGCVSAEQIIPLLSKGGEANFSLREIGDPKDPKFVLEDLVTKKTYSRNGSGCDPVVPLPIALRLPYLKDFNPFSTAHAAEGEVGSVENALMLLESESPQQRDAARDFLAKSAGPDDWAAMTQSWNIGQSSYRGDLGRLVAWVTAIRKDRRKAVEIGKSMTNDQFAYTLQLAGYGDSTMRSWATEFVSWQLQASAWTNGLTDRTKTYSDLYNAAILIKTPAPQKRGVVFDVNNRIYNLLVAAQYSGCNTSTDFRSDMAASLTVYRTDTSYGPKVRQLADDVGKAVAACK